MSSHASTPDTVATPPHLTEGVFRTYERAIATAVRNWPTETCFTVPSGIAPTTFTARFRDAILSLKKYSWSTSVDTTKFWSLTGKYVIARDEAGNVWFRQRAPRGRELGYTSEARTRGAIDPVVSFSRPSVVPWTDSTQEEIAALCLLLHNRRLTGPFIIDGAVGDSLTSSLEASLDVSLVYDQVLKQTVIQ
jgi:hypothetical protein